MEPEGDPGCGDEVGVGVTVVMVTDGGGEEAESSRAAVNLLEKRPLG